MYKINVTTRQSVMYSSTLSAFQSQDRLEPRCVKDLSVYMCISVPIKIYIYMSRSRFTLADQLGCNKQIRLREHVEYQLRQMDLNGFLGIKYYVSLDTKVKLNYIKLIFIATLQVLGPLTYCKLTN